MSSDESRVAAKLTLPPLSLDRQHDDSLPDDFDDLQVPEASRLLDDDGSIISCGLPGTPEEDHLLHDHDEVMMTRLTLAGLPNQSEVALFRPVASLYDVNRSNTQFEKCCHRQGQGDVESVWKMMTSTWICPSPREQQNRRNSWLEKCGKRRGKSPIFIRYQSGFKTTTS